MPPGSEMAPARSLSAAKEKPAPQQKQAQPSQAAKQQEVNAQPQPQQTQAQQPPAMPQPQATPPAYRVPEPDITMKYGVMLGLPPIATVWLVTVLILIGAREWAA